MLDKALFDVAVAEAADTRFGVTGLLGAGTAQNPVHGVKLEGGDRIEAR